MITLSEVRQQVNSTPDSDGQLELIRAGVIARWERETSILWDARTEHQRTIRLDRCDRTTLYLPLVNIAPASVAVETKSPSLFDAELGSWEELEDTKWVLARPDEWNMGAAPELVRVFAYWPQWVRVTMDGGFDASTCPAEIKRALLLQVHFEFQRWQESGLAMVARSVGQSSANYLEGDLHPTFDTLAKRYAVSMVD